MSKLKHEDILNDPDFKDLSSQKFTISIILTVLELVLYFGFIGLIAFNKAVPGAEALRRRLLPRSGSPLPSARSYFPGYLPGSTSGGRTPSMMCW